MSLDYLRNFGLLDTEIEELKNKVDDKTYSELGLFENIVKDNIQYMVTFGIGNTKDVVAKFPEIFLRDAESFRNIFSKFDKADLIAKVEKNPAVFRKMVDFVDNN